MKWNIKWLAAFVLCVGIVLATYFAFSRASENPINTESVAPLSGVPDVEVTDVIGIKYDIANAPVPEKFEVVESEDANRTEITDRTEGTGAIDGGYQTIDDESISDSAHLSNELLSFVEKTKQNTSGMTPEELNIYVSEVIGEIPVHVESGEVHPYEASLLHLHLLKDKLQKTDVELTELAESVANRYRQLSPLSDDQSQEGGKAATICHIDGGRAKQYHYDP